MLVAATYTRCRNRLVAKSHSCKQMSLTSGLQQGNRCAASGVPPEKLDSAEQTVKDKVTEVQWSKGQ